MSSPEGWAHTRRAGESEATGDSVSDHLVPRPAATVMLIRDTAAGIKVFLMRRHRNMDFVGGVMVFPGGGVDDRDRNADIAWHGPDKLWWAERLGQQRLWLHAAEVTLPAPGGALRIEAPCGPAWALLQRAGP